MDFQAQVAARRAELERQAKDDQSAVAARARQQQEIEKAQREAALDAIAVEISTDGVEVVREGDRLAFVEQAVAPIDIVGLRRAEVKKLIKREARRMWTPDQNWVVIAPTVAGFCLLPFAWYFSVLLWGVAAIARHNFDKRYEGEMRLRHPSLFLADGI